MKYPMCDILEQWYELHGRDLPWRRTRDAYAIWLSEVILQQTRISEGRAYYETFLKNFPTVYDLAHAEADKVMKLWQGLGYYSRARNLHAAARMVVEDFGGQFPTTYEDLLKLKGVGEYTAAAIASFAYDCPKAVVDGNVYRVLSRLMDEPTPIDTTEGRKLFARLAQEMLDVEHPATYNQAIMDFGALVCTPQKPHCEDCPLRDRCQALEQGSVAERPRKQGKLKLRERWFHYLHLHCEGETVLCQRGEGDIWQGLYELPLVETEREMPFEEVVKMVEFQRWTGDDWLLVSTHPLRTHRLTHQILHGVVYEINVKQWTEDAHGNVLREEVVGEKPIPKLLERYFEER